MTSRDDVGRRLMEALTADSRTRVLAGLRAVVDVLLPVVGQVADDAYWQGREDETTDIHSSEESSDHRWWEQ